MTERLDEHKMKYAVDTDKEAEDICRWAAARAGVIVVAPVVGTMTLMANEVYMITRLAKLRGVKLSESAVLGLLGSLGGAFVGQTLATLIPFAPVQIPVGMSVTYAVGKVANAWLAAGCPEDSHLCLFERSDDYCSVAYWYQELPTNPFPELPDRKRRMEGI